MGVDLPPASLDAVITDPPYFGNVQYAELMDFCYVWLRRLLGKTVEAFKSPSTRNANELTGNVTMDRDLKHFTAGLSEVFCRMAHALKPGAPFTFTYHHNSLDAYYPVAVAILDAGLVCSASLPCPAEMGGSIHINKTGSSIIDTVFVCRSTGKVPCRWIASTPEGITDLARDDLENLRAGTVIPTRGDLRCISFGHMIRMTIWHLRHTWNRGHSVAEKLASVKSYIDLSCSARCSVLRRLNGHTSRHNGLALPLVKVLLGHWTVRFAWTPRSPWAKARSREKGYGRFLRRLANS